MDKSLMPDPTRDLISVVIPVYEEAEALQTFLASVRHVLDQCSVVHEIVLIDDGSSDDTWPVVAREAKAAPAVRGFRLSRNFGKEAALCAGLEKSRGAAVIVMDGDGQHPASLLPEMIRMWKATGADIVQAVKRSRGRESVSSKAGAVLFYVLLAKFSGFDLRGASDFKLMSRKAVNAWLRMGERNVFFRGMTAWMGFTTVQIPFEVAQSSRGQSTWSYLKRLKLAITGITAFSSLPLQLVTFAGAVFLAFSVILSAQTIYLKLTGQAVSGFTTVILLELIIGSFLMISLGIIGEYLARIYREVKARPRYLVTESTDASDSS